MTVETIMVQLLTGYDHSEWTEVKIFAASCPCIGTIASKKMAI